MVSTESLESSGSSSTHYISSLLHRLKNILKKSGYTDVRYGLMTIGCYQNEQFIHMHTINGYDIFTQLSVVIWNQFPNYLHIQNTLFAVLLTVLLSFFNLEFCLIFRELFHSQQFLSHLKKKIPQIPASGCLPNAREAIQLTSLYPFRDVASRFVLLLTETEPQVRQPILHNAKLTHLTNSS